MTQEDSLPKELRLLNEGKKGLERGTDVGVGDIIIVEDIGVKNNWSQGRCVETFPNRVGVTRVVGVKTRVGNIEHPMSKIRHLDIQ